MKFFKSSWFWFLFLWLLVGGGGLLALRFLQVGWSVWYTVGLVTYLLAGTAITVILWQRARMLALTRGVRMPGGAVAEEPWKKGLRSDLPRLVAASSMGGREGVKMGDGFKEASLFWVVSANPDSALALLLAGGAVDVTLARAHELSGEFAQLGHWCSLGGNLYLVLRDLPDPKVLAGRERVEFLVSLLQEKGKLRPVDGAVVVTRAPGEGVTVSSALQPALACLAEVSSVEFPVHVLFEGAERLPGGTAFFSLLERENPGDLPGASLPITRQERLPEALDQAWAALLADLDEKLQAVLQAGWTARSDVPEVFGFLQALEGAGDAVKATLRNVCGQFIGSSVPFVRSFAFAASAASVDGAAEAMPTAYWSFLAAEPALARLSSRKQTRSSLVATGLLALSLAVSAFLLLASVHGFVKGGNLDDAWKARLKAASEVPWQDSGSIAANLARWNDLRNLEHEIRENRPWSLAPGFYRNGTRLPLVRRQLDTMTARITKLSFAWQEQRLQVRVQDIRDSLSDTKDLYSTLKTYLLLTTEGWAQGQEKEGVRGLGDAFVKGWGGFLGYEGQSLPQLERQVLPLFAQDLAERVKAGELNCLGHGNLGLVEKARLLLRSSRNQSGTYARMLGAADTLAELTLDSLGISQQEFTCSPVIVPKAYTRKAYLQAIQPTLDGLAGNGTDWVVGKSASDSLKMSASSEVLQELRRRYFEDYQAAWQKVLDNSTCVLPSENQKIAAALTSMGSAYNPQNPRGLLAFLKRVSDETDLTVAPAAPNPMLPGKVASAVAKVEKTADVLGLAPRNGPDPVALLKAKFAPVRALSDAAAKGGLEAYLKDVNQLAGLFSQWSQGDGAFQFAKGMISEDQKNPLVHAWNEAKAKGEMLPVDQRPWFDALTMRFLQQIADRILPQAAAHASTLYRDKVFSPWQNLVKGAYPFDPYGQGEAAISEVDAYLNPRTGSFGGFLKDMDGILVVGDRLKENSWNGKALPMDRNALEAMQKLLRLQTFFYGKNGTAWKGCQLTISVRGDQRAKVGLRIGSQNLDIPSGSGEKRMTLRWPVQGQSGAVVQATTITSSFEEHKDGEWALLRLLEARGASAGPGSVDATWSFNDRSYIVDVPVSIRVDQSSNPFREKDFFQVNLASDLFR